MKIAAIDIGANSVHLVVSRIYAPGVREVLDRAKEMLRLGEGTFRTGALPPSEVQRALALLKRYRAIAEAHGVEAVLAVATSAVRDARNREDFVRRAEKEARLSVRVLSGEEEGRLIYQGVREAIAPTLRRIAVVDIGGGSMEVVIGEGAEVIQARCLKLGVLRLAVQFPRRGSKEKRELEEHVRALLRPVAREVKQAGVEAVFGTSGTILTLAELLRVRDDGWPIRLGELEKLSNRLLRASPRDLKHLPGVGEGRADTVGPGSLLVRTFMEEAEIDDLIPCERALREGVVADYAQRNAKRLASRVEDVPDPRRRSILFTARRLACLDQHAWQTARLSLRLFDLLAAVHGMGLKERELLEYAALLHDAGYWIASEKHHKHAFYLIRKAPLEGFSREEILTISLVARYHRGSLPRSSHPSFGELPREARDRVRGLAAILRIADGLDRSHASLVKEVGATVKNGRATFEIVTEGDPDLELYAAERRSDLFQKVFDREVRFKCRSTVKS